MKMPFVAQCFYSSLNNQKTLSNLQKDRVVNENKNGQDIYEVSTVFDVNCDI